MQDFEDSNMIVEEENEESEDEQIRTMEEKKNYRFGDDSPQENQGTLLVNHQQKG